MKCIRTDWLKRDFQLSDTTFMFKNSGIFRNIKENVSQNPLNHLIVKHKNVCVKLEIKYKAGRMEI